MTTGQWRGHRLHTWYEIRIVICWHRTLCHDYTNYASRAMATTSFLKRRVAGRGSDRIYCPFDETIYRQSPGISGIWGFPFYHSRARRSAWIVCAFARDRNDPKTGLASPNLTANSSGFVLGYIDELSIFLQVTTHVRYFRDLQHLIIFAHFCTAVNSNFAELFSTH